MTFRPLAVLIWLTILTAVVAVGGVIQATQNGPTTRDVQRITRQLRGVHEVGPCRAALRRTGSVAKAIRNPECVQQARLVVLAACHRFLPVDSQFCHAIRTVGAGTGGKSNRARGGGSGGGGGNPSGLGGPPSGGSPPSGVLDPGGPLAEPVLPSCHVNALGVQVCNYG